MAFPFIFSTDIQNFKKANLWLGESKVCLNEKSESGLELICDFHIGDNRGGKKKGFLCKEKPKDK